MTLRPLVRPLVRGPLRMPTERRGGGLRNLLAVIGDSQAANGVQNTATSKSYRNVGVATIARALSLQSISSPLANNLGVGGTTYAAIKGTAAAGCALGDFVLVHGGSNDAINDPIATCQANFAECMYNILAFGKIPIVTPIQPRVSPAVGFGAACDAFIAAFNSWLYAGNYGSFNGMAISGVSWTAAVASPPRRGTKVIFLDGTGLIDGSNAPLTNTLVSDGLHWGGRTSYAFGNQLQQVIAAYGLTTANAATPAGSNIFTANGSDIGLMTGTTGSLSSGGGFTASGSVATGWALSRGVGTSTMTATASKAANSVGEKQRLVIATSVAGTGVENVQFQAQTAPTLGFSAGDRVVMEMKYSITGMNRLANVAMQVRENGPASPQTASDLAGTTTFLIDAHTGTLRTDPITLQSGTTSLSPSILIGVDTAATPAGVDVSFWEMRLVKLS